VFVLSTRSKPIKEVAVLASSAKVSGVSAKKVLLNGSIHCCRVMNDAAAEADEVL
jgi:hypothetical protein